MADDRADEPGDTTRDERELVRLRARVAELEAAAIELEERFHALVEGSFDGLTLSIGGKIVEANATFAKLSGYSREEVIGMTPLDLATRESAALAFEHIRAGNETPYEAVGRRKDGSTFPCEILGRNIVFQGKPARLSGFRDISERKREELERKRLEQRMLHTQKLETLEVLAGGIAHEFNNLMLIVLGHAELSLGLLAQAATAEPSAQQHLEQIKTAVQRARELVGQMLTYAGRARSEPETIELASFVRDACELVARAFGERARLRLELAADLPALAADPVQLRQLLTNLITNAFEALGEAGGEVTLRAARVRLLTSELEQLANHYARGAGEFVRLEVEDGGPGMDANTRGRIFEPFFSTKWRGRGLGLPAVLGIVRAHRGALDVRSEPGRGARFVVYLPLGAARAPLEVESPSQPSAEFRSQGVALLADDERMLRDVGAEILRSVGFEVLTARDGQEAVELFRAHAAEITVVLLDATMPRMGGVDALHAIRALARDTPVVLMSGFHDADASALAHDPRATFLAKPFEIGALLRKLREFLQ